MRTEVKSFSNYNELSDWTTKNAEKTTYLEVYGPSPEIGKESFWTVEFRF
jgi:hypothetical protein